MHSTQKEAWAARPPWHSRRHQTSEAQDQAREAYKKNRGRKARQDRAMVRWLMLQLGASKPYVRPSRFISPNFEKTYGYTS